MRRGVGGSELDLLDLLELLGVEGSHRLACQAVIRPGEGLVTLRWAAD